MRFFKALMPLLILIGACSFKSTPPQENNGKESASFALGMISPLTSYSVASDPNWGVASSRAIELRAKVLDSATLAPRVGEKFMLWRDNQSELLEVDSEGNIKWTEVIPFLSLAPERLIPISRRISGRLGTQTIRFAVNPWSDSLEFIDLTHQKEFASDSLVPEADSELALTGQNQYQPEKHTPQSGSNLVVERLELNLGEAKSNQTRWMEVGFEIHATRRKRDGSFAKVNLPAGNFRVTLKFLQEDPTRNQPRQWAGLSGKEATVNQGKLVLKTELPISEIPEDSAQLKLHYYLEPVAATVGLLPTQGEFLMNGRSGRMSGTPVEQPRNYELSVSLDPRSVKAQSFAARRWTARFGGEQSYDVQSWQAQDYVDIEVCIVDPLSHLPLAQQKFQVALSENVDGKEATFTEATSDLEGCLNWTASLSYGKGEEEKEIPRYLVVRGAQSPYQNDSVGIAVAFNPWQRGELYFRDIQRKGKTPYLKSDRRPQISAKGFRYSYENPTFESNRYLQLITHRQYQATMEVGLFRPGNLSGTRAPELIREGTRLRVRGLLLHPLFVDKTRRGQSVDRPVLAGFEATGVVDSRSEINFVMNFPTEFTQGALLDARTKVMIEVGPETPSDKLPAAVVYSGPFKAVAGLNDLGETLFSPSEFHSDQFDQLWETGKKSGKTYEYAAHRGPGKSFASYTIWRKAPLELFTHYWQSQGPLTLVGLGEEIPEGWLSLSEWNSRSATPVTLLEQFQSGEAVDGADLDQFLGRFCKALGKEATPCLLSPQNFFHISTMQIVDTLPEQRLRPPSVSTPLLQVTTSYFREYMFSKRDNNGRRQIREHAESKTSSMGAGLFSNGFAYTRSFIQQDEFYDTTEAGVQDDLRARLQMQEQLNLSGEGKRFEFEAKTRRCLMVRPTAAVATIHPEAKNHIFCSSPVLSLINESWYYIWDQWRQLSSSNVDPRDPWQRGWMKLIRGGAEYEYFKSNLSDGVRFFVFKKVEPYYAGVDSLVETAFQTNHGVRFQEDGGIFPGVTHYRELSPLKWTEPQIERYVSLCEGPNEPDPTSASEKQMRLWSSTRKYCRCYYENAAQVSQHGEFAIHRKAIEARLIEIDVPNTCLKYGAAK